jgi:hypothetical protein
MANKHADYASYLLRLWKVEEDGQVVWRASLEDTRQAERRNFTNLAALIAFLQAHFGPADREREAGGAHAARDTDTESL